MLEDSCFIIDVIIGMFVGVMNVVVLVSGLEVGGEDGVWECLEVFWREVSGEVCNSFIKWLLLDVLFGQWSFDYLFSYFYFDVLLCFVLFYEFNLLNVNLLRDVVEWIVDFDKVYCCFGVKLFIVVINVFFGKIWIFSEKEVMLDVVMVFVCLLQLFQVVEIDGEFYWDGGFMGNLLFYFFFYEIEIVDVVFIQINLLECWQVLMMVWEIVNC